MKVEFNKLCRKVWSFMTKDYSKELKNSSHRILVCYLSEPFYHKDDSNYFKTHQNRRETLIMSSVFEELNWSYCFMRLDKPLFKDVSKYDIIFGCGSSFVEACNKNVHATKIYYATGSYFAHQNKMIKKRTDDFNKKHDTHLKYSRLALIQNSNEISDAIIQIGSKYTLESYPQYLRYKIKPIHQTCFDFSNIFDCQRKFKEYGKNNFIFMGSKGSILKGLDIVLDFFEAHPELIVHLFGIIDNDFYKVYSNQLNQCPNIVNHGFKDISSKTFLDIAYTSPWVLLPSVSEGCPGSVINCMKVGCIPIVTRYAACEEAAEVGFVMQEADILSLCNAIELALSFSDEEIEKRMKAAIEIASINYNETTFKKEFKNAIEGIIKFN